MKIEEKRRILRNFCKNTTCDDCKLNSILYGWITPFGGEHCLDIDHSPECDLEKALALIGYVPNIQTDVSIKDSGERTQFETGAQRDMHEGKGDMASVPWEAILRLSKHYENGARKYERWNFRKGIPVSSFIDSACRHLAKYQCGCDDEDHLSAAAFNVLGAMLMENTKPEMIDLPLREGKKTFNYFDETNVDK